MYDENEILKGENPTETTEPPMLSDILAGDETVETGIITADEPVEIEESGSNEFDEAVINQPEVELETENEIEYEAGFQPETQLNETPPALHISDGVKKSVTIKPLLFSILAVSSLTLIAAAVGLFVLYSRINTAESELERQGEYIKNIEAEKSALEADYVEAMNIIDAPAEPESTGIEAEEGKLLIYESTIGYAWVPILADVEQHNYRKSGFNVDERSRMSYTDENGQESSYFGIDVSSYQGSIDWQLVREDGVEFAFIRAGFRGYGEEGRLCADENFNANYDGAHSAGIDTGVYFFSQAVSPEEAVEEAEFLLDILDGRPLEYPIVFDWETVFVADGEEPPRTEDVMPQTLTLSAIAFCETIEDAGYKSMIYTNKKQAVLKYDLRQLKKYPIWFAYYDTELNYCYKFDVWQYGTAFVDGIDGEVDVNIAMIN